MRATVLHNNTIASLELAEILREKIAKEGILLDEETPEIVLSVGGDGTLLSAFHTYKHLLNSTRFVGVHTGHLGFYTDWRDYELDELVTSLKEDTGKAISYPLLRVSVEFQNSQESKTYLALNESIVRRLKSTMVGDVYIKNELFECFRGDGLSVSTPTGSTAYNKSVGGAVLHPRVNALQLTEIASLNNRVYRTLGSPLIIANDEWIEVHLKSAEDYLLTIDQLSFFGEDIKKIKYRIADERIQFAAYRHTHFWRRVKDSFIGGSK